MRRTEGTRRPRRAGRAARGRGLPGAWRAARRDWRGARAPGSPRHAEEAGSRSDESSAGRPPANRFGDRARSYYRAMSDETRAKPPQLTLGQLADLLPGTGEIMASVGVAWWKCVYAARGGNW